MSSPIRISDKNNDALKEIKREYDLNSIDESIALTIKNTPLPVGIETEPPAFILEAEDWDIKPNHWENRVSWNDLRNSKTGDIFDCEVKSNIKPSKDMMATILFKDENGVFIRFDWWLYPKNENELNEAYSDIAYYSFI